MTVTSKEAHVLNWEKLLSSERRPGDDRKKEIGKVITDHRTSHERDFDRVTFCTPVRRLKDKTQVFPLEMHDGVRTRLTHSLEVSSLARSMGIAICARAESLSGVANASRDIPALLSAIALTHDLGNPPFGHQGEVAIQSWMREHEPEIRKEATGRKFRESLFKDFLAFEGNAQGFRILTRLQHQSYSSGLRLTASTLRAFMKYPWSSKDANAKKGKFGFFESEREIFKWCSDCCGLFGPDRHPLSYIMEACDDIAYSVLDLEDGVKKEIISVADFISFVSNDKNFKADERVAYLIEQCGVDRDWLYEQRVKTDGEEKEPFSNKEIRDSQVELLRSWAIALMVSDAIDRFLELEQSNSFGSLSKGIAENCTSTALIKEFKDFDKLRIYRHPDVLSAELAGHHAIPKLMTVFWNAIRKFQKGEQSKLDEYAISLISPNYFRAFWQANEEEKMPTWYLELQLVCDQVCGMTDSYAMRLHDNFKEIGLC